MEENNMTEKERFDAISILYKQSWDNFNERRKYEWKVNFSIYTIYAISISGILLNDKLLINTFFLIGGVLFGGILLAFHLFWIKGIGRANFIDRKIALYFEKFMQQISSSEFSEDFIKKYLNNTNLTNGRFFITNWNHFSQVGVSLSFYIALIFSLIMKIK